MLKPALVDLGGGSISCEALFPILQLCQPLEGTHSSLSRVVSCLETEDFNFRLSRTFLSFQALVFCSPDLPF